MALAIQQAISVRFRLQEELQALDENGPVQITLPEVLTPIRATDSNGNAVEIAYESERTLLFIIDPEIPNFTPELQVWNRLAAAKPKDISLIGLVVTREGWAGSDQWPRMDFPVVALTSAQDLERNSIAFVPATVLVSQGGKLQRYWFGAGKLKDPRYRNELADAVGISF